MSIILKRPVAGPAAWSGSDLGNETDWIQPLTPDIIDGLDSALAAPVLRGAREAFAQRMTGVIGGGAERDR